MKLCKGCLTNSPACIFYFMNFSYRCIWVTISLAKYVFSRPNHASLDVFHALLSKKVALFIWSQMVVRATWSLFFHLSITTWFIIGVWIVAFIFGINLGFFLYKKLDSTFLLFQTLFIPFVSRWCTKIHWILANPRWWGYL